ncbi:hypothetical protein [Loktanella sp. S4079]|uniref:hypothetical protein n=1 Tax=Loktanella sp. S4079 TaxID=579483 RepID=UPI00061EC1FE|nr:hypothetical protein [Loktanella sp. S4079]KJZ20188.1 hypothetical protein TW80_04970 [Loktanella sp. S4079]
MTSKIALASLLVTTAMTPAFAQNMGLSAASVEVGTAFLTGDGSDANQTSLEGTAEFAITPVFTLGASLGLYGHSGDSYYYEPSSYDATNLTAHALYKATPTSAIGVFVATESTDAHVDNINAVGVEFGMRSGKTSFDAYYAMTDLAANSSEDYTFGGMALEVGLAQGFTVGASYDAFSPSIGITSSGALIEATVTDVAVSAGYDFGNGFGVEAELGRLGITANDGATNYTAADPEVYVGLNVSYDFGGNGGTFTKARSFMDLAAFSLDRF